MESFDVLKLETDTDLKVEYQIIPAKDASLTKFSDTENNISRIDDRISEIQEEIRILNSEIDDLTNHADGLDYIAAIASGLLSGFIDSFFVGEFSLENANKWGSDKVNKFVEMTAKSQGCEKDGLKNAIEYLEKKFPIASDSATSLFGGGRQHHLRDFAHHPTLAGLLFSLLTQFTEKAYGTDTTGRFIIAEIKNKELIGKNFPCKILYGTVFWFFHMVSDMAGSSSNPGAGTGLPGPLLSFAKEISALPFFKKTNSDGNREFSVWISRMFNGTELGSRDANGKLIPLKFDLRTEIGAAHELGKQSVPVIINECIVRGFYFIRRFACEIKSKSINSIKDLSQLEPKNFLPYKNRTVIRMLTISTGTFTAVDLADAAIRAAVSSGGVPAAFGAQFILRVNFVGVGRFAVAVVTDSSMGIKRAKMINERIILNSEQLYLLDAKVFYKQSELWIAANEATRSVNELTEMTKQAFLITCNSLKATDESLKNIESQIDMAEEKNPGLKKSLLNILK